MIVTIGVGGSIGATLWVDPKHIPARADAIALAASLLVAVSATAREIEAAIQHHLNSES